MNIAGYSVIVTCSICSIVGCGGTDRAESNYRSDVMSSYLAEATTSSFRIVRSIASKNRIEIYVACWTLRQNGVDVPDFSLDVPYDDVRPHLDRLAAQLLNMDEPKLRSLDESLEYHWSIYSPHRWEQTAGWNY